MRVEKGNSPGERLIQARLPQRDTIVPLRLRIGIFWEPHFIAYSKRLRLS